MMMGVQDPWVDRDGACSFPDKWSLPPNSSPPNSSPPNSSSAYSFCNYRSSNTGQTGSGIIVTNAKLYVGNYSNPVFPLMTLKLEDSLLKVRVIELILRLTISNFTPVLKSAFCFESKIQLLFSFCLYYYNTTVNLYYYYYWLDATKSVKRARM